MYKKPNVISVEETSEGVFLASGSQVDVNQTDQGTNGTEVTADLPDTQEDIEVEIVIDTDYADAGKPDSATEVSVQDLPAGCQVTAQAGNCIKIKCPSTCSILSFCLSAVSCRPRITQCTWKKCR